MKLQSTVSSFNILVGYFTMHLTLWLLSLTISVPEKEELEALRDQVGVDEYECFDKTELKGAL